MPDFEDFKPKKPKVVSMADAKKNLEEKQRSLEDEKLTKLQKAQDSADEGTIDYLFHRGKKEQDKENYDLAEADYEKVLELNPKHTWSLVNLAKIFVERDEQKKAKEYLQRAIDIDSTFALAWANLGVVCDDLNERQESIDAYEMSINLDPTLESSYYNLAGMYQKENNAFSAISYYEKYSKLNSITPKQREEALEQIRRLKRVIKGD